MEPRTVASGIYDRVSQMVYTETSTRYPGHPARVSWNNNGVPTVMVASPNGFSELFGMGAALATQRLFQLHMAREAAYARLAATTYRPAGTNDTQYAALVNSLIAADGQLLAFSDPTAATLDVAALTVREQALYQAYIDGINAFIANFPSPADKSPYLGAPSGITDITTPFVVDDLFAIERAASTATWVFISLYVQLDGQAFFLGTGGDTAELNRFYGCRTRRTTYRTLPLEVGAEFVAPDYTDCGLFQNPMNPHHATFRSFFGIPQPLSVLSIQDQYTAVDAASAYDLSNVSQEQIAEAIANAQAAIRAAQQAWAAFLPTAKASSYIILTGNRTVDGAPVLMYAPHQESVSPNNQFSVSISDGAGITVNVFHQVGWPLSNARHMVSGPCFSTAFELSTATLADISLDLVDAADGFRIVDGAPVFDVRQRVNYVNVYNGGASYQIPLVTPEIYDATNDRRSGSLFATLYPVPNTTLSLMLGARSRYYQRAVTKRDGRDDFIRFFDSSVYTGAWNRCPVNIDLLFYSWNGAYGSASWFTGYADRYGRIQAVSSGALPVRSALSDPRIPMLGMASAFEWTDFIAYDQQPHDRYPARNYLIGANNRFEADDSAPMTHVMWAPVTAPARAFTAELLVRQHAKHSLETARTMVASRFNGAASLVVPRILANVDANGDPDVALGLQLLAAWTDYEVSDNIGGMLWETMDFQTHRLLYENMLLSNAGGTISVTVADRLWEVLLFGETGTGNPWTQAFGAERTYYDFITIVLRRSIQGMRGVCSSPVLADCNLGRFRTYLAATRYTGMQDGRYDVTGGAYPLSATGFEGAFVYGGAIATSTVANQPSNDGPIHRRALTVRNDVLRLYSVMHPGNADCPAQICIDERVGDHRDQVDLMRTPGAYQFSTQFGHAFYPQSRLFACSPDPTLSSARVIDRCGVCGGNNATCGACVQSVSFWKTRNSERPSAQQRIEWPFNLEDRRTGGVRWLDVIKNAADSTPPLPSNESQVWRQLAEQYVAASLNVVRGSISDVALGAVNAANIFEAGVLVDRHVEIGSMTAAKMTRARQLITTLRSFNNGGAGVASC